MSANKEKKSFHPVRHFRLSDKNVTWLKKIKKGTWNRTMDQLRRANKKIII